LLPLSVFALVLALGLAGSALALDRAADSDAPAARSNEADANVVAVFLPGHILWVSRTYAAAYGAAGHHPIKHQAHRQNDADANTTTVIRPSAHDTSPPLSAMLRPRFTIGTDPKENDNPRVAPLGLPSPTTDTAVQLTPIGSVPTASSSFEGAHNTDGYVPPDTNGDIGGDYYVEWVNASFSVYNRTTGALDPRMTANCSAPGLSTPACEGNSIWAGFSGTTGANLCAGQNEGDPIVKFDGLANRWVFTQFAFAESGATATGTAGPYYQCVAVSSGVDPIGSTYQRYAYKIASHQLNDYPKVGIWPDGYYFAFNLFDDASGGFPGAAVAVADRAQMIAGNPTARMIVTKLDPSTYSLLPADLEGTTAPPSGTPEQFVQLSAPTISGGPDALQVYTLATNWTAGTTTWAGPSTLSTAAFDPGSLGENWILQPGGAEGLDALSDRLMYRLAYRNLGTKQVMAVTHTVDASGNASLEAAPRWYELQNTGGGWSIADQGTYHPDSTDRWMASVGLDHDGNLGMVYSFSSDLLYPSVGFTGRLTTDPAGALETGRTLVAGNQSQEALDSLGDEVGRWGDYASMTLDPSDDCTFYMAEEYFATGGETSPVARGRNWHTRIGSFFFPGCMAYAPTSGSAGTSVVIRGKRFENATAVSFNGTAATVFTTNATAHTLTVTVPSGATTGAISVTSPAGTFTSETSFTVGGGGGGSALITGFTPTSAGTGATVTINGTGFSGATAVRFNGVAASTFTVVSGTQVTAKVPAAATYGPISVVTPGGTATSATSFAVVPTISGISPTTGTAGTTVTITGTGFSGASGVKFNGVNASFSIVSPTSITTTVPGTASSGPIVVTLGGSGQTASSATFTPKPAVPGMSPTSGPVGTTVVLTGTNLSQVTAVAIGTRACSFTVNSATQITVTVPAGALTEKFKVSGPAGSALSPRFTVT
jgi:hypothetical protein